MHFDLERFLTPSAWFQLGRTDWDWDAELNEYLDTKPEVLSKNVLRVVFPKYKLWISNYSYGNRWYNVAGVKLPSVKTRKRLRAYIS